MIQEESRIYFFRVVQVEFDSLRFLYHGVLALKEASYANQTIDVAGN